MAIFCGLRRAGARARKEYSRTTTRTKQEYAAVDPLSLVHRLEVKAEAFIIAVVSEIRGSGFGKEERGSRG